MPRQDTRLEAVGAEFLVLAHLLINRITAHKTYTNIPGYDLIAASPENSTSARIQVKSRWETNASGFPIKNFYCDFLWFSFASIGVDESVVPKLEIQSSSFFRQLSFVPLFSNPVAGTR